MAFVQQITWVNIGAHPSAKDLRVARIDGFSPTAKMTDLAPRQWPLIYRGEQIGYCVNNHIGSQDWLLFQNAPDPEVILLLTRAQITKDSITLTGEDLARESARRIRHAAGVSRV